MNEKRKRGQYGSRDPWRDFSVMLNGYAKYTGVSIGRAIGACENTGRNRLNNPETFTIGELKKLCKVYGITQEEIYSTIKIGI